MEKVTLSKIEKKEAELTIIKALINDLEWREKDTKNTIDNVNRNINNCLECDEEVEEYEKIKLLIENTKLEYIEKFKKIIEKYI